MFVVVVVVEIDRQVGTIVSQVINHCMESSCHSCGVP
jgi:hypothetical protein